jgi:agmatinase
MLERQIDRAIDPTAARGIGYEPTYSGVPSLFRRPFSTNPGNADIAVLGVPLDLATTNRPGARFGPRAIRAASTNLSWEGATWPWGFDPFLLLEATDCGDCFFDPGHPVEIVPAIEARATELMSGGASLISLGGDHFVSYPLLRALHKIHGPLALVHFDAHTDTWRDDGSRMDHGTMFYRAAVEGLVTPQHSVQIGIRTHNPETFGYNIIHADFVHQEGPGSVAQRILEVIGTQPAYLTFDIDCLDPAFAPGTGTPVVGGLSTWQAQSIIRRLSPINFVGMDLVEVAPPYDTAEITALAAASLLLDYICLRAKQANKSS